MSNMVLRDASASKKIKLVQSTQLYKYLYMDFSVFFFSLFPKENQLKFDQDFKAC